MANRITGTTDTTGAISVRQKTSKSLLIVCKNDGGNAEAEKIYSVNGTADAKTKFGNTVHDLVKTLINNGVGNIKCISIGTYGAEMSNSYKTLPEAYGGALNVSLSDNTIKTIIFDTNDPDVSEELIKHLESAEYEDMFRYGVIGSSAGEIAEAVDESSGINNKRVFMPFPDFVDTDNSELSCIYTAAGLAALIMTETSDPAMPMNGVEIKGFGGTTMSLLKANKDSLEQGGVTAIVGNINSNPYVWRLVTTCQDEIWHEGTTLFIADDILETMISTLQSTYKRTKNTARVLDAIRTTVIGVLEAKEGLEIIENFDKNTVSVVQDPDDIYGVLIDYEFNVVTPLYTITIAQHMKL